MTLAGHTERVECDKFIQECSEAGNLSGTGYMVNLGLGLGLDKTGFPWLGIGYSGGFFQHNNKLLVFIKCEKFVHEMNFSGRLVLLGVLKDGIHCGIIRMSA
jgi:hypothetical protein